MSHVRPLTRKDGSAAYEVRWRKAGRFKQRTFRVKREAERFALRVEDEMEQGSSTDVYVKRSNTLADVVAASMAATANRLRPKTFSGNKAAYRLLILPVFGTRRTCRSPARRSRAGCSRSLLKEWPPPRCGPRSWR